jgi:hypothetical protein
MEPYDTKMQLEINELESNAPLPSSWKTAFIHGYQLAAYYWHRQGLKEGWDNHIREFNLLMNFIDLSDEKNR